MVSSSSTLILAWNAPALALERAISGLEGRSFHFRTARVRRLRRAGRDAEADRTLLAMQADIAARRRRIRL